MTDKPDDALLPKVHSLKCWPDPFGAMERGEKTAEFRLNDRDFREGDILILREWCPVSGEYTGQELRRTITHVLDAGFGLPDGYAMLSLNRVDGDTDFMCPYWSGAYWKGYEAHRAGRSAADADMAKLVEALREAQSLVTEAVDLDRAGHALEAGFHLIFDGIHGQRERHFAFELVQGFNGHGHVISPKKWK